MINHKFGLFLLTFIFSINIALTQSGFVYLNMVNTNDVYKFHVIYENDTLYSGQYHRDTTGLLFTGVFVHFKNLKTLRKSKNIRFVFESGEYFILSESILRRMKSLYIEWIEIRKGFMKIEPVKMNRKQLKKRYRLYIDLKKKKSWIK